MQIVEAHCPNIWTAFQNFLEVYAKCPSCKVWFPNFCTNSWNLQKPSEKMSTALPKTEGVLKRWMAEVCRHSEKASSPTTINDQVLRPVVAVPQHMGHVCVHIPASVTRTATLTRRQLRSSASLKRSEWSSFLFDRFIEFHQKKAGENWKFLCEIINWRCCHAKKKMTSKCVDIFKDLYVNLWICDHSHKNMKWSSRPHLPSINTP